MSEDKKKEKTKKKAINTKRWLYYFEVPRKTLKKVKEEKTDEEGKKFTIEQEEEVEEVVEIYLRRPTRRVYDECNLFYSVKISEGIKKGLMTRAMLSKRYRDDQGALSDEEKAALNEKYNILLIKEKEFQVIQLNLAEVEMSLEVRQERLAELVKEIEGLKNDLESFEFAAESLYEHTAESRAARLTNMWWLLHLTHFRVEENGIEEFQPFFIGKNFEKKMEAYSMLEERIAQVEDRFVDFETSVIEKATYLLSAWNGGNVATFEDFERVEESLEAIQEEVKKDDTLQVIYEQKVKELASLENMLEVPAKEKHQSPKKEKKEEPEKPEEPKEPVSE
jgi:hypothetical protein|tara:strand:+ start:2337 stop:3344 length:1008 start_codon:yes stop_codon:yes gene_type:complete